MSPLRRKRGAEPPAELARPADPLPRITVVGLGPAGPDLLTVGARRALSTATVAFLRTARHPAAAGLGGLATFDAYYDAASSFDEVYRRIVEALVSAAVSAAGDGGRVVYAVPGSPSVAERTVELLRADPRVDVDVVPALSFLDLVWDRLGIDPVAQGVRLVDGTRFAEEAAGFGGPMLVAQCWSSQVLSDIKLSIDGDGDGDGDDPARPRDVSVLHHLGLADERVERLGWEELDRFSAPDHLTSLFIAGLPAPVGGELIALDHLVHTLRQRCPWDRQQTHASLTRHLLEESYEVVDAIEVLNALVPAGTDGPAAARAAAPATEAEADAVAHLQEELGDLLFQVYFHACLAAEEGRFTLADVARGITDKLVARHPHVFGDTEAADADAVVAEWERSKMAEKGRQSVTEGIPKAMPALALAAKLQRKAIEVEGLDLPGFDSERAWLEGALKALAAPGGEPPDDDVVRQVGALLWAVSDLGRQLGVEPEDSLRAAALRFGDHVRQAEDLRRERAGEPGADSDR